jgi:hypothetical protein
MIDPARTLLELRRKLTDLDDELDAWQRATASEPLQRHHTQIEAVAGTLSKAARELSTNFGASDDPGPWITERAPSFDRRILDLHRLWGFFRNKLALRFVPWLEEAMVVSDDLAWACYEQAQQRIGADMRREPPLVYFSGGASPVLLPRGTPYVVEPLPDGGMPEPQFSAAVRAVPVALIGLPWLQINHLPDGPLIAHEVGHAVEHDLGIAERVAELITGAVPECRRDAWRSWSSEAFADVYGVLGCGSGFAHALAARLAAHPRQIAGETRSTDDWGSYPPLTTRILLTEAVLDELEAETPKPSIADKWLEAYPQRPLREFEDDAPAVAAAVLRGTYCLGQEETEMQAILSFAAQDESDARRNAKRLLDQLEPDVGGVRHVMAAARLAYDCSPEKYDDNGVSELVRNHVAAIPLDRVRAAGGADTPTEDERATRDAHAASALVGLISDATAEDHQRGGEHVQA